MSEFIVDPIQIRRDTALEVIRQSGDKGLNKNEIAQRLIVMLQKKQRRLAKDSSSDIRASFIRRGTSAKTIHRDLTLFKDMGFVEMSSKTYRITAKGKQFSSAYFNDTLSDKALNQRLIYSNRSTILNFAPSQYQILDKVKDAIIKGLKVSFVYDKTSGQSERKVEPIGVVQDRCTFKLIALKAPTRGKHDESLTDRLRVYIFPKMSDVNVLYDSRIFSKYTHDEAINWLHSGVSEYRVSEEYEHVILKLSKSAALELSCAQIKSTQDWQFEWLNQQERTAKVSFLCQPSISIVSLILGFGKFIDIEKGDVLKKLVQTNRSSL